MAPKRFRARVQGGMLVGLDRAQLRREIAEYEGKPVVVTITDRRSDRQNAWIWGVALPIIADHLGYDRHEHETLHYDILAQRFGTVTRPSGLVMPTQTSSKLSVKDFSDYMDWLVRYAAETWGVVVPLPDEVPL